MNVWQYNGMAQWSEIIQWCEHHLKHWHAQWETITFYDGREYVLFLLRWSDTCGSREVSRRETADRTGSVNRQLTD